MAMNRRNLLTFLGTSLAGALPLSSFAQQNVKPLTVHSVITGSVPRLVAFNKHQNILEALLIIGKDADVQLLEKEPVTDPVFNHQHSLSRAFGLPVDELQKFSTTELLNAYNKQKNLHLIELQIELVQRHVLSSAEFHAGQLLSQRASL